MFGIILKLQQFSIQQYEIFDMICQKGHMQRE